MKHVERNDDMSPRNRLVVMQQEDGDMIVGIIPGSMEEFNRMGFSQSVEFCTIGMGGGRSPRTLEALRALMHAIEEDNQERPIVERTNSA
jgi:hypothetical protein